MSLEIERKFLVQKVKWKTLRKLEGLLIRQGYLTTDPERTVRVRYTGNHGFLTLKGASVGAVRAEYEYQIPAEDARQIFDNLSVASVSKVRYKVSHGDKIWEVDEFLDENEGLILAEIELKSEDEDFEMPPWIGTEVTADNRYYNAFLAVNPFRSW